jgi:phosphonopyruvate decarboxylase
MNLKFGVPCSRIKDKIQDVDIPCASEEQAFAVACGCILAGKEPVVYMQNSGLARSVDVITSLYLPYKIPYPKLILSLRHSPFHHAFIGSMTNELLSMLGYHNVEIVEQDGKN